MFYLLSFNVGKDGIFQFILHPILNALWISRNRVQLCVLGDILIIMFIRSENNLEILASLNIFCCHIL